MSFYRSVSCCALLTWLPGAFAAQVPEAALLRTVPWTDPLNPHAMVLDRDRLLVQQVDGLKVWELTANRITPAEGSPYPSERTELKRDAAPLGRDTLLTLAALDHPYGQPQPQALAVWSHDTQRLVAPLPLPEWRQVYRLLPLDDGHALVCGEPLPVAVGQPPRLRARVVQYAEGRLIWRQEPDAALSRLLAAARISGEVEGLGRSEAAASSPLRFDTAACRWQAGPLPGVPAEARDIIVTPVFYPDGTVLLDVDVAKDSIGIETSNGPAIDTRRVKTKVLVSDGGTVVLGGIFEEDDNVLNDKTPFLGDIPGLGVLFRGKNESKRRAELLIFLTPVVLTSQ